MRYIALTALAALIGGSLWLASAYADPTPEEPKNDPKPEAPKNATLGQAAPDFTLEDQAGNKVTLSSFKGKIIVLEWTCPTCPYVKPHFKSKTQAAIADKFKDKGVVWLAINSTRDNTNAGNSKVITDNGLPFPILNDAAGTVGKIYGAKTTPHVFIVDKNGVLVYAGGMDNKPLGRGDGELVNYVEKAIGELLDNKEVSTKTTSSYG